MIIACFTTIMATVMATVSQSASPTHSDSIIWTPAYLGHLLKSATTI